MAPWCRLCFSGNFRILNLKFSTSCFVGNKWRREQGLEPEPRKFGPLTNFPDYSFVDGRPVPLSLTKKRKILEQQQFCKQIVELSHELDVELEQYYQKKEQMEKNKEMIIRNKLKPKGAAFLSQSKKNVPAES